MKNKLAISLEWDMNESGMSFTTVFGTVRKSWEQIVGLAFGFEVQDSGWTNSKEAQEFCDSFAVKEYDHDNMSVIINARHAGTLEVTPMQSYGTFDGRVNLFSSTGWEDDDYFGTKINQVHFSQIIEAL